MWYFAWLLGLPLAAIFAVMNAMWYELMEENAGAASKPDAAPFLMPVPARRCFSG
ncbi:MAG: cytochrome bd-I oxidase subunit CydX [Rhizobium sp.]|nr:MAG: cytochrome bd-I oxidase subunit CydX [Rhizobium sp.]